MAKYESLEEFIGNLGDLDTEIPDIDLESRSKWPGSGMSSGFEGH